MTTMMVDSVSPFLGHQVPGELAGLYLWVCLWGCLEEGLAVKQVD